LLEIKPMSEQLKFPFKKQEETEEAHAKIFRGRRPTLEDDEELTISEGGRPTSEKKIREAKEKAVKEFLERMEKEKGN
jgi:hypothetical protein